MITPQGIVIHKLDVIIIIIVQESLIIDNKYKFN